MITYKNTVAASKIIGWAGVPEYCEGDRSAPYVRHETDRGVFVFTFEPGPDGVVHDVTIVKPNAKSGDIPLSGDHVFRWMLQGDRSPEIYGWVENADRQIVDKSSGFFRTDDAAQAARIAASNHGLTVGTPL